MTVYQGGADSINQSARKMEEKSIVDALSVEAQAASKSSIQDVDKILTRYNLVHESNQIEKDLVDAAQEKYGTVSVDGRSKIHNVSAYIAAARSEKKAKEANTLSSSFDTPPAFLSDVDKSESAVVRYHSILEFLQNEFLLKKNTIISELESANVYTELLASNMKQVEDLSYDYNVSMASYCQKIALQYGIKALSSKTPVVLSEHDKSLASTKEYNQHVANIENELHMTEGVIGQLQSNFDTALSSQKNATEKSTADLVSVLKQQETVEFLRDAKIDNLRDRVLFQQVQVGLEDGVPKMDFYQLPAMTREDREQVATCLELIDQARLEKGGANDNDMFEAFNALRESLKDILLVDPAERTESQIASGAMIATIIEYLENPDEQIGEPMQVAKKRPKGSYRIDYMVARESGLVRDEKLPKLIKKMEEEISGHSAHVKNTISQAASTAQPVIDQKEVVVEEADTAEEVVVEEADTAEEVVVDEDIDGILSELDEELPTYLSQKDMEDLAYPSAASFKDVSFLESVLEGRDDISSLVDPISMAFTKAKADNITDFNKQIESNLRAARASAAANPAKYQSGDNFLPEFGVTKEQMIHAYNDSRRSIDIGTLFKSAFPIEVK
ncbi:MAG: hypothetical protein U9Q15_00020 [Patescibacteria group bacterium]|nr:hypothetical protein [Patescibacteria group bacterium]